MVLHTFQQSFLGYSALFLWMWVELGEELAPIVPGGVVGKVGGYFLVRELEFILQSDVRGLGDDKSPIVPAVNCKG